MKDQSAAGILGTAIEKIRDLVDVKTIVGEPVFSAGGITIIPVSKVSYGFASGGSDFNGKSQPSSTNFGGGSGAGVNIAPVAFLIVKDGTVRVMNIAPPASSPVDRLVESAPDLIDKISGMFNKEKKTAETEDK